MRTSHLVNEHRPASTACGYPWEPWQDSTTRVTLELIEGQTLGRVRVDLRETREQQRRAEEAEPVRLCPACARIAAGGGQ